MGAKGKAEMNRCPVQPAPTYQQSPLVSVDNAFTSVWTLLVFCNAYTCAFTIMENCTSYAIDVMTLVSFLSLLETAASQLSSSPDLLCSNTLTGLLQEEENIQNFLLAS